MRTSCRLPKKRRAGLAGPRADPLVRAGDPARGDALGPAPDPTSPRDRLVVVAPRPSGRRPKRSPKTTTVVLEELIEACGADFESLHYGRNRAMKWKATCHEGFHELGITPHEALAKLWLSIHSSSSRN